MLTHNHSSLPILSLTFTGALIALLTIGCTAPTVVGTQGSALSGDARAIAFHQEPDQETLHVAISTLSLACSNPGGGASSSDDPCPAGWTVTFALPAASQAPGVYSLSDPAFQSVATMMLGADGNGSCFGGGSGLPDGTVEILSIDASGIKVRLAGFNSDGELPLADGDYNVSLCM